MRDAVHDVRAMANPLVAGSPSWVFAFTRRQPTMVSISARYVLSTASPGTLRRATRTSSPRWRRWSWIKWSEELKRQERDAIAAVLKQTHGKVSGLGGAAELLGAKPTTLASRIVALGINRRALN